MNTATASSPMLAWALHFASMGWNVFPLRPNTKKPTGHREADCPRTGRCAEGHWTPERRATTDAELVRSAWADGQRWNIGIATGPSGLVVVDLDVAKPGESGPDGATALAELAAERGGPLPDTYTVTTPTGGRHLYFTSPPGVRLRSTQKHVCANVDTRAWGGYVVAAGSVLPEGGYELADDTEPVPLPAWLVQACAEKPAAANSAPVQIRSRDTSSYGMAALAGEVKRVRDAEPGSYNGVLSSAAYTIGRKVGAEIIDAAVARAELIAAGETLIGSAHWPPNAREVARVVDAGLAAGAANPVARRKDAA
ncbi:bifunctional DNA primase/polymerase [Saccharothrix sp. AJ9571]|nr:bifunctional DNA primase/polymerase [Saccharothrix sp. AJ9571]